MAEVVTETEVVQKAGADRYERSGSRGTYRNGYRLREWKTRVGSDPSTSINVVLSYATPPACVRPGVLTFRRNGRL